MRERPAGASDGTGSGGQWSRAAVRLARPLLGLFAGSSIVLVTLLISGTHDPVAGQQPGQSGQVQRLQSGAELYIQNCASCHGQNGQGGPNGPSLVGVGPANLDFQMWTGRMPLAAPDAPGYRQQATLTDAQRNAIIAYAAEDFAGSEPAIPQVVASSDLRRGWELYVNNCAACHGPGGAGGAIGAGNVAPALHRVDAVRLAEATIVGPGVMPSFVFSDEELAALAGYVAFLRDQPSPGGISLSGVGPVPEGFIAAVLGLGGLLVAARWVGRGHQG